MNILQKLIPLFVLLAILGLAAGGFFYYQYQKTSKELQSIKMDPLSEQKLAQEEVARLLSEVGNLIALPTDEQPTVATITDVEKLKEQPFFKNAKNGDKVIIFAQSKKAILYDPNAKKIIDVAPVNIGSSSAQQNTNEAQVTPGLTTTPSPTNVPTVTPGPTLNPVSQ